MKDEKKVALFIDADNISYKYIEKIIDKSLEFGKISIKRIYADWSNIKYKESYKKEILKFSLTPMQHFSLTNKNKNATDMHLIADLMDVYINKDIDIFIIISSDSDYASVINKLRENNKFCVGMGETKSVQNYKNTFDKFIILNDENDENDEIQNEQKNYLLEQKNYLQKIILNLIDKNQEADFAKIHQELCKKYPDFDHKNYGFTKFSYFMKNYIKDKNYDILKKEDGCTYVLIQNNKDNIYNNFDNGLLEIILNLIDKNQEADFAKIHQELCKKYPDFDHKNYGFTKFSFFIENFIKDKNYKIIKKEDGCTYVLQKKSV